MKKITRILFVILSLCLSTQALALDVQSFNPRTGYLSGYQLYTSQTLPAGYISLGVAANYTSNPLEVGRVVNNPRVNGLVDDFATINYLLSAGLTNWLTVNVDMPMNAYYNIGPVFIANRDQGGTDAGDLRFTAQIKLLDAMTSKNNWGVALVPYITAPTGNQARYFGDTNATGGAYAVVDKIFGEKNHVYMNVGVRFREKEVISNLNVGHELLYGIGYQRPISEKHGWHGMVEFNGSTTFSKFWNEEVTSPFEGHLAVQKRWLKDRNLVGTLGVTYGLTVGYSAPDYRIQSGLSYTFGAHQQKKKPFVFETVHFPFDSDRYYQKHETFLNKVAKHWKKKGKNEEILLRGHTDGKGDNQYNINLANRRANRVKSSLVKKGVPSRYMTTEVLGESEPQSTNNTERGRHLNRRVEVLFYK